MIISGEGTYRVDRLRDVRRVRRMVRVGVADPRLTPVAGMTVVTELVDRLGLIDALNRAVGPIKQRDRGYGVGQLLVGLAAAQLAGEEFRSGWTGIAPLWRLLSGIAETDWRDAIDMDGPQVAVATTGPAGALRPPIC